MCCLWRERNSRCFEDNERFIPDLKRNSRCFEDNERFIPDLKLFFFRTLLDWLAAM